MKNGRILELAIPKIKKSEQLKYYKADLLVPYVFGEPAFILPQPQQVRNEKEQRVYSFSSQQITNQSITAVFGDFQIFNFALNYYLENQNTSITNFKITLPPDTSFQKIFLETLEPPPLKIDIDPDGNWLATYQLQPKEIKEITATGSAKIFMNSREDFQDPSLSNNLRRYLQSQEFWPVDNPQIKKIAENLKTPLEIYNFVVNNLLYDYERVKKDVQRRGAIGTLENKESAICMAVSYTHLTLPTN